MTGTPDEVGLIHLPIGMNLFVIQARAPEIGTMDVYRAILGQSRWIRTLPGGSALASWARCS